MPELAPMSTSNRSSRHDRWVAICGSLALVLLCLAYAWAHLATGSESIPPAEPAAVQLQPAAPLHIRQLVNQTFAPDPADPNPTVVCITLQLIDATPIPGSAISTDDGSPPGCATSHPTSLEPATLVA